MTPERANALYDVLVEAAGADEYWRENFVHVQAREQGCHEYRFQGSLGFGGKFWRDSGISGHETYRVSCYREDETPERRATIARTNTALASAAARADRDGVTTSAVIRATLHHYTKEDVQLLSEESTCGTRAPTEDLRCYRTPAHEGPHIAAGPGPEDYREWTDWPGPR